MKSKEIIELKKQIKTFNDNLTNYHFKSSIKQNQLHEQLNLISTALFKNLDTVINKSRSLLDHADKLSYHIEQYENESTTEEEKILIMSQIEAMHKDMPENITEEDFNDVADGNKKLLDFTFNNLTLLQLLCKINISIKRAILINNFKLAFCSITPFIITYISITLLRFLDTNINLLIAITEFVFATIFVYFINKYILKPILLTRIRILISSGFESLEKILI